MRKIFTLTFIASLLLSQTLFCQTFNYSKVVDVMYPTGVMFDSSNDLWYVIQGSGLFEFDGTTSIDHNAGFGTTDFTSCDNNGTVKWSGGYGGAVRYDGTPTNYSSPGDLQGNAVYDVDVVGDDVWLAMENEGASHFDGTTWTHYSSTDGLIGDWFTAIDQDSFGNVWLSYVDYSPDWSTSDGVVSKFDGTTWTTYSVGDGISLSTIMCIYADSNGDIWIGGDGLMKFDGTSWTLIPTSVSNNIHSIMEDNAGNIWFADSGYSVYMYDGISVHNTNNAQTFGGRTDGIAIDASGELYFCLQDGIYTVDVVYTVAPVTEFSINSTAVCLGDVVYFTDMSSNGPYQWAWDFGDGNSSSMQNPVHQYTSTGTFTVSLTATNAVGADDEIKTDYIVVNTIDNGVSLVNELFSATASGVNYQWIDCNDSNALIPGENDQDYTAIANGSYAVIVSDGICIDTSSCLDVTTIGITQQSRNIESVIYPNPANNILNIDAMSSIQAIEIYSVSGKLVYNNTFNSDEISIDISDISVGQYIVKIITNNKAENSFLIKQ